MATLPSVQDTPAYAQTSISPSSDIEISIVVPAYNEEENLEALIASLDRAIAELGTSCEIVIVDDGSSDATWSVLHRVSLTNPRLVGISLSRNFGHQGALLAGLS